ncbi:MAG: hypothetical protein HUU47_01275 [Bacteroidetes bacterium]|nr:hypothetical protein [Bacteroidota bacterium]
MSRKIPIVFIFLILIILVLGNCNKVCNNDFSKEKAKVINVLEKQAKSWNEGNLEKFMNGYEKNDSTQFITQKGRVWGWNNIFKKYKKHYTDKKKMGKLNFSEIDVRFLNKNIAQAYGKWQVQTDTAFGSVFSVFLRKNKNNWLIFIDHTW